MNEWDGTLDGWQSLGNDPNKAFEKVDCTYCNPAS
jgi:hypothetical protein